MKGFRIKVPASTGNLGPGFDCLGAALTLYNYFEVALAEEMRITASGPFADRIAKNKNNLVYQSFDHFFTHLHQPKPIVALHMEVHIPLSRGLGSSATATIGGLMAANLIVGNPLSQEELCHMAATIEGHPDNVVPAILGGCQLIASSKGEWTRCPISWHQDLTTIVAVPDFELSTAKARQVLPKEVPMQDAIFNAAHLALLIQGLGQAHPNWLQAGLHDRLHQPYRQSLIPGMAVVEQAAKDAGALGVVISGAGPTLLAVSTHSNAKAIGEAMVGAWQKAGIIATAHTLGIDLGGTTATVKVP